MHDDSVTDSLCTHSAVPVKPVPVRRGVVRSGAELLQRVRRIRVRHDQFHSRGTIRAELVDFEFQATEHRVDVGQLLRQRWGLDRPSARIAVWSGTRLVREVLTGAVDGRIYAKADHRPEVVEIDPNRARRLNMELVSVVPDSVTADTILLKNRSSAEGSE